MIYFTSDLHFGHDKEFIWKERGYSSVEEMNEALVENWNKVITDADTVYILGDVFLGDPENIEFVKRLKGLIMIIRGNHDTDDRFSSLLGLDNVFLGLNTANIITHNKRKYYLCHYPTILDGFKNGRTKTVCLFGHTHQKEKTYKDYPRMLSVGVDAWGRPVSIKEINKLVDELWGKE